MIKLVAFQASDRADHSKHSLFAVPNRNCSDHIVQEPVYKTLRPDIDLQAEG